MANKRKETRFDPTETHAVTCATAVTDTRLAYRLKTTDNEVAELCGDNERCVGFPDRKAAIGEAFNLRKYQSGSVKAIAGAALATNNLPVTTAANGKFRTAVIGTDLVQFYNNSTASADGDEIELSRA